jgi:hypothetical protein
MNAIQNTEGFPTVTIRQLEMICRRNLKSGWQPIGLLSEPGAGKSMFPKTVLRRLVAEHRTEETGREITTDDIGIVTYRVAQKDAAESAGPGIPFQNDDGTYVFEFSQAPLITKVKESGREIDGEWVPHDTVIVILDEFADGDLDQQNVFAPLLDPEDYTLGDDPFPENTIVFANGNRPDDLCGSMTLSSKVPNRSKWFNLLFDPAGWKQDFAIPNNVNPVLMDWFMMNHEEHRARSVPEVPGPFCTARSVAQCSGTMDQIIYDPAFNGTVSDWEEADLAANIGQAAGRSLVTHMRRMEDVPKPHEIFADPHGCKLSPHVGFQLLAASAAMSEITDMGQAEAALEYIMRCRTDLQIRLGVKLQEVLARSETIDASVLTSPVWAAFDAKFHKYLHLAK